jgi:ABC-2 type transport system permease protein
MPMGALIRFEVKKLIAQKKSLMGIATVILMNALFALAFILRSRHADRSHELVKDRLIGEFLNAFVYVQYILPATVHMVFPTVLAILAAYSLAGEIEVGSMRMLLFRPVSRWQVLFSKFMAMNVYGLAMLLVLGLSSYGFAALILKPTGDVFVFAPLFGLEGRGTIVHPAAEMPLRIVLSYALALPMLCAVNAMALMFAMLTRHFTSAAILTAAIYLCSHIAGVVPLLSSIHRFLPTRYLPMWRFVMLEEIPWPRIGLDCGWTAAYTAGFLLVGVALFNMRDQ